MNTLQIIVASILAAAAAPALHAANQQPGGNTVQVRLTETDPRPLAAAVVELSRRHHAVITYEDAPCEFIGDQADVTEQVRTDLHQFAAGQAPRVLIPKGGRIDFAYDVDRATGQPADLAVVLDKAALSHRNADHAGRFGVLESDRALHVVPVGARDADGALRAMVSPLDSAIRLGAAEVNGLDRLEQILAEVSRVSGQRVIVGTVPVSMLARLEMNFTPSQANAREALLDLFGQTQATLSWQMLHDPTLRVYVLNVYAVE